MKRQHSDHPNQFSADKALVGWGCVESQAAEVWSFRASSFFSEFGYSYLVLTPVQLRDAAVRICNRIFGQEKSLVVSSLLRGCLTGGVGL